MKRFLGVLVVAGFLAMGVAASAVAADFSGDWAVSGGGAGATMTIRQHGDQFHIVVHNAEGQDFGMSFTANGQEQQLRSRGQLQQMIQASWQGDDLVINSRVLVGSKVRRQLSMQVSPTENGSLNVSVVRRVGQQTRTRHLVLERQ